MRRPDWLEIEGGPLVMLSRLNASLWLGDDEQYDSACAVDGTGKVLLPAGEAAFVIADEPMPTCFVPELSAIVQWISADSEGDIEGLVIADDIEWSGSVEWSGSDPILFEAALHGGNLDSDEYIGIPDIDGVYSIRSADVRVGDHAAFVVHQLSYLRPRSA